LPARELLGDLAARFNYLKGGRGSKRPDQQPGPLSTPLDIPELQNDDNDKTVEDLLAELGPAEQWDFGKHDNDEVDDLLKAAREAIDYGDNHKESQKAGQEAMDIEKNESAAALPSIDVSVFQPEPESGEDEQDELAESKERRTHTVDQEADEYLQQILDEIKHAPAEPDEADRKAEEGGGNDPASNTSSSRAHELGLDLPSAPSKRPEPPPPTSAANSSHTDADLAARFASLSLPLPSVPTTLKSKSTKPPTTASTFTDAEIETWCIICSDDATLRCIGCDGDQYCSNCWMEGHRGESAGFEERRHRAVQFVKGPWKKKQTTRKVMVGA
jgi:hypothetical protein